MAGTLTISTLSDGTNSTSSTNCIQGSAKAWVTFTGGASATINASYNISSVTKTATGQYTVVMTNALADVNYCVATGAVSGIADVNPAVTQTTTTFGIRTYNDAGSYVDQKSFFAVFR